MFKESASAAYDGSWFVIHALLPKSANRLLASYARLNQNLVELKRLSTLLTKWLLVTEYRPIHTLTYFHAAVLTLT